MPDPAPPSDTGPGAPRHPFEGFPAPVPPAPLRVVVADDNPVVRAGLTTLLSSHGDITVVAQAADGREAYEAAHRHRPDVVLLDVRMPGVDGLAALPHLVGIAPVLMLTYSGESEVVREALRRGAGGYLVHGEFTADRLAEAVRDVGGGRPHFTATAADALLTGLRRQPGRDPAPDPAGEAPPPEGRSRCDDESATAYGTPSATSSGATSEVPPEVSAVGFRHATPSPNSAKGLSRLQPNVGESLADRSRFRLSAREAEIMDLIASGMTNQQIAAACFISEKTVKNHVNHIFAKLHSTSRAEATAKWLGTAPDSHRGRE